MKRTSTPVFGEVAQEHYRAKVDQVGTDVMHQYERAVMLQSLDTHWREHLAALDHLRQGIHLRGYAQKNPKQEYKREAFELFTTMLEEIKTEVTRILLTVQIRSEQQVEAIAETQQQPVNVQYQHAAYEEVLGEEEPQEGRLKLRIGLKSISRLSGRGRKSAGMILAHADQERNTNSAMGG